MLIAKYFNALEDEKGEYVSPENEQYADVNLDNSIDLTDVVALLRSVVGGYGARVLSNEL